MAVQFKDYYESLGVASTSTAAVIKKAYRKLSLLHHPDVAKDKITSEATFREITEAYQVLSDPEKRKRYDELGPNWDQPVAAPSQNSSGTSYVDSGDEFSGTDFSEFFENYFADGRGGFGPAQRSAAQGASSARRGHHIESDLLVTLTEVLRGTTRSISLRRPTELGVETRTHTYNVKIPAGVHEGQLIRLSGQGAAGSGNGTAGDLFLRIHIAPHPEFRVNSADLYYNLTLSPWEAVLGVKVSIPALDGNTDLKVSPLTEAGSQLRLRGLGLPKDGNGRGDLFVTIHIQIPPKITPDEQSLWEKLGATATFNPRAEV